MVLFARCLEFKPWSLSMVVNKLLMDYAVYLVSTILTPLSSPCLLASAASSFSFSPELLSFCTITFLIVLHFLSLLYPSWQHPNDGIVLPGTCGNLTVLYLPESICCSPPHLVPRAWQSSHQDTCSGFYQPNFACFDKIYTTFLGVTVTKLPQWADSSLCTCLEDIESQLYALSLST